jgi:hypothetical protein
MAAFLKSKKKISSVKIHPLACDLISLIDDLNLTIKARALPKPVLSLIEDTIKMEGVLDSDTGELLIFSPFFELQLTSKTLEQMLGKSTITHRKEVLSNNKIETIIWGQFFKHIATSIRFVDDIALIQPKLKKILPINICKNLFGKKHLTQQDFSDLINEDRGLLARTISKTPPPIIKSIQSSSSTFVSSSDLSRGKYE